MCYSKLLGWKYFGQCEHFLLSRLCTALMWMLNFLKGSFWSLTGTSFNAMMNLSNVLLQRRSREHLGAERAMLAHIFMNFSDVTLEIRCIEGQKGHCLRTLSWTCLTCRAKLLKAISFSQRGHFSLIPEWATCMCCVNLDDLICFVHSGHSLVSPLWDSPYMAFYPRGVDHFVAINALYFWLMDAFEFDVHGEIPRCTESFTTLRTLVGHLITSCST